MNKDKIKEFEWDRVWAGGWSLLTCSEFGERYINLLDIKGHSFMSKSIFFSKNGKSSCAMTKKDKDSIGQYLVKQAIKTPGFFDEISRELKKKTDVAMDFIEKHVGKEINEKIYSDFWKIINEYYEPHICIKYVVDYLEPAVLDKYINILEEARVYAEPVFEHSEEFMQSLAAQLEKKHGCEPHLVLCMLRDELINTWQGADLPDIAVLRERYKNTCLLFDVSGLTAITGEEVDELEKMVFHSNEHTNQIKGSSAYPGIIKGVVRIVMDPAIDSSFKKGDILVTGMTRPEFIQLVEQSGAIITDAGGILSHAAITAREMKKPCIIGTKIATKVLKDGDMVEVDADNGIIKFIKL